MKKRRLVDAVLLAFGSRDEITLDELRSVVFAAYSEPELMRRGAYYSGKKTSLTASYISGEHVDDSGKRLLVRLGISKLVMDLRRSGGGGFTFDKEAGIVSRVRK